MTLTVTQVPPAAQVGGPCAVMVATPRGKERPAGAVAGGSRVKTAFPKARA